MANNYLHGAYADQNANGTKASDAGRSVIVYVGTAPVHQVAGGAVNVNRPVLVSSIADARRAFGYSDNWEKYTLCEAIHVHLAQKGVGPLVLINVLDPAKHKAADSGSISRTPENGRVTILEAEDIILDSVTVTGKEKDKDYTISYNITKRMIVIQGTSADSLGTETLTITYDSVNPAAVENDDVIGHTDGIGENTGLFAIRNVYSTTGFIPAYIGCPGFSGIPMVHAAMKTNSQKINGHWDAWMFTDIPIVDADGAAITLKTANAWKKANGYTNSNETVSFPMVQMADGKKYHLSVLRAANFQQLLIGQDGIPYRTASNTDCGGIENLYLGEAAKGRIYDDEIINEYLNQNGIASAAYVGGRWCMWGAHAADYNQEDADNINVSETTRMMMYYISNDFQHRRTRDVDQPLTPGDIRSIVSDEQARLDALIKIGALTYADAYLDTTEIARSDMLMGNYAFTFNVTTVPLANSLKAIVNWTDEGFVTYFSGVND